MDESLHYLLMADHTILQKKLFTDIKGLGLSMGQPKVLDFLKDHDGAVQKEIAGGCHIEPASLSAVLAGMERNGLIRRQMSENSRRNITVSMTDKGWSMCRRISEEFSRIEDKALAGFTEKEIESAILYLKRIQRNLEEYHGHE